VVGIVAADRCEGIVPPYPDLIPDFQCAFNRALVAARRKFVERTGGAGDRAWLARVKDALGGVRDAMAAELGAAGDGPGPPS
jgi:hypothetical protein